MMQPIDKAKLCLKTIRERKAVDPVLLHVEDLTSVTDYFLITSGNSTRQVQAITRHLQRRCVRQGSGLMASKGSRKITGSSWITGMW